MSLIVERLVIFLSALIGVLIAVALVVPIYWLFFWAIGQPL